MGTILFGGRLSPFVEKVASAMEIKGMPFELVEPKSPGDFKKWNPQTQKMPVLEIDGKRHYDSTVIVRLLDELVPEPALLSKDREVALRQRFIEDWSDESLYWYLMGFRWAPENEKDTVDQLATTLPPLFRPIGRILFPRLIGGQARAQGLARLPLDTLIDQLGERFDELVCMLGDRPFFFSDQISVADLAVFGQMQTMKSGPTPQCEELISERPTLADHYMRVDATARPPASGAKSSDRKAA